MSINKMKEEGCVCVLEGSAIPSWPPVERQLLSEMAGWNQTPYKHTWNEKSTDMVAHEPEPPVFTEIINIIKSDFFPPLSPSIPSAQALLLLISSLSVKKKKFHLLEKINQLTADAVEMQWKAVHAKQGVMMNAY